MDMSYFVFQDSDYQLFSESVLDEMLLGISSKDKKENTQKAKSILNVLGLDKYIDKHPFALSRGEKQRLTIACGMCGIDSERIVRQKMCELYKIVCEI